MLTYLDTMISLLQAILDTQVLELEELAASQK
jgi:hypothetical protein